MNWMRRLKSKWDAGVLRREAINFEMIPQVISVEAVHWDPPIEGELDDGSYEFAIPAEELPNDLDSERQRDAKIASSAGRIAIEK